MEYINISKRFIKESGNNLSKLVNEAIEKHDMYERFKSDQNFRYQIINVLGKNGIAVHGGPISFNAFDPSKMKGGNRAVYGPGAYFTDKAYKAEEFGMGGEYMFANLKDFNLLNLDGSIDQMKGLEDKYGHAEELKIELTKIEHWLEDRTYPIQDLYKRLQEIESELKGMFENESDKEFYELYHQARLSNSNTTLWDVFQFLLKRMPYFLGGEKFVVEKYMSFGYDGWRNESEIIIFNFDKLNQNMIQDKEGLIWKASKLIGQYKEKPSTTAG